MARVLDKVRRLHSDCVKCQSPEELPTSTNLEAYKSCGDPRATGYLLYAQLQDAKSSVCPGGSGPLNKSTWVDGRYGDGKDGFKPDRKAPSLFPSLYDGLPGKEVDVHSTNQRNRELGYAFSHKGLRGNTGLLAKADTHPSPYPCLTKIKGPSVGRHVLPHIMLNL
jgi:hypothetical protein